ncbi:hypothetical protein ACFV2Z_19110 [Streptomyces sp. NPDC059688]|uniref:hypothetical protein n=1 Tax=Streptomyces sp. NPDC059688 TaxID=3346906 RepID=UPI00369B4C1F
MGASSDGYTVRSGMSGQAKELDGAGDDAGHIRAAVSPAMCYTEDALGGSESAAAFNAFAAAWETDAATLESALHELAGKVRLAKGAYTGGDHTVGTRAEAVRVGADGLTTMPAPAGNDVTTMPAHAGRPSALSRY